MGKRPCTVYDCEYNEYIKAVMMDDMVYIFDQEGNMIHPNEYVCEHIDHDMVQFFTGYYSQIFGDLRKDTSKWGYFRLTTGKIVVPPTYDYAYPFYGDYAKVVMNGKYGFIDPTGKVVVPIELDYDEGRK